MRRFASRWAIRQISWMDQHMRFRGLWARWASFFGCRSLCLGLARLMTDGGHHGEGEYDERGMAVPTVPGSGLVMVEA